MTFPQHFYRIGVMGCETRILFLFILLHNAGCQGQMVTVTCYRQAVCALQGSQVSVSCNYPPHIKMVFWFSPKQKAKWRNDEHPEDLALDSDYAGRVRYTEATTSSSILTITDLRETDSGEYHLMLFTRTGEKYHSSTAVNLTVTDLQMRVKYDSRFPQHKSFTCHTSCALTSIPKYSYWYKNGQYKKQYTNDDNVLHLSSDDEGSYSCSVQGFNDILSPPVCVSREACWSVSYTDRRVCVVEGSSVEIPCTFSYPSDEKVEHTFWYYVRPIEEPQDLNLEEKFAGRVEYVGDKERSCTLRIRDLRKGDSGEYRFRFSTISREIFSGKPGVILNVTDLQVRVSSTPVSEGQTVTLSCSTTCTLPYSPNIWYKNGRLVTNNPTKYNKLLLQCSEEAGNYSCGVRGQGERRSAAQTVNDTCPDKSKVLQHIIVGVAVCLALILIAGALWMWRRKSRSAKDHKSFGIKEQCDPAAVYNNVSAEPETSDPTQRASDDEDGIHYSSVHFNHFHTQTSQSPPSWSASDTTEEQSVHYAAVNFSRHAAATQ